MHRLTVTLLLLLALGTSRQLTAQLRVSRQVLAATVQSSTPANGNALQFTAHAGEFLTGTVRGDLRATTGFQQPDDDVTVAVLTVGGRAINVRAYPNPVSDQLTVELAEAATAVAELTLSDLYGRPVLTQTVNRDPSVVISNAGRLPSGMYLLRARTRDGALVQLARVLVVPH